MDYLLILIGSLMVNHFMAWRSPAPEKRLESAAYAGVAVILVATLAALISHAAYMYLLAPMELDFLYPILYLLVAAALAQTVGLVLKKCCQALYELLAASLPLILINSAVLAVYLAEADKSVGLMQAVGSAAGAAFGLALAGILFDVIRERLLISTLPKWMKELAGALITAGLMAVAFLGLRGLIG